MVLTFTGQKIDLNSSLRNQKRKRRSSADEAKKKRRKSYHKTWRTALVVEAQDQLVVIHVGLEETMVLEAMVEMVVEKVEASSRKSRAYRGRSTKTN